MSTRNSLKGILGEHKAILVLGLIFIRVGSFGTICAFDFLMQKKPNGLH